MSSAATQRGRPRHAVCPLCSGSDFVPAAGPSQGCLEQGCSLLSQAGQNPERLAERGARHGHCRVWGRIPRAAPPRPVCPFSPAAGWGLGGIFFLLFFPLCTSLRRISPSHACESPRDLAADVSTSRYLHQEEGLVRVHAEDPKPLPQDGSR